MAAGFFVVLEVFFGGGGVSSFLRLRWLVVRSSSTLSNRLVSSRTRNDVSLEGGSENFGDSRRARGFDGLGGTRIVGGTTWVAAARGGEFHNSVGS